MQSRIKKIIKCTYFNNILKKISDENAVEAEASGSGSVAVAINENLFLEEDLEDLDEELEDLEIND